MIHLLNNLITFALLILLLKIIEKRWSSSHFGIFLPLLLYTMISFAFYITSFKIIDFFGNYITFCSAIIVFVLMAIGNYFMYIIDKIKEVEENDMPAVYSLFLIGLAAISGVTLFSVIYLSLYRIFPTCFNGKIGEQWLTQFISFMYFSVISFTTVGFGDIYPNSNLLRILVSLEAIWGFATVVYGISSFSILQQAFNKAKQKREEAEKSASLQKV